MIRLKDVESVLNELWGDYKRREVVVNRYDRKLSYFRRIVDIPTCLIVVQPAVTFNPYSTNMDLDSASPIKFFLYDMETDLIIGSIIEIPFDNEWTHNIYYRSITAESKLMNSVCPECSFWLTQRTNQHGHNFMGCSGFPECDYSDEIENIYDDEN